MKIVEYEFLVDVPWELAMLAYDRKSWNVPSPEYKVHTRLSRTALALLQHPHVPLASPFLQEILRCEFDEWDVDEQQQVTKFRYARSVAWAHV